MKFLGTVLLLISMVVNLQAGKVTWADDGSITIAGTDGQGCIQSRFGTDDENTTKANCS